MNSTIVITGANRGLGLCLANRYLDAGWTVFAGSKMPSPDLLALGKRFPGNLIEIGLDVTDGKSVSAAVAHIAEGASCIDILVNNAAVLPAEGRGPLPELAIDVGLRVFDVNALGPLRVTQALLPLLAKSKRKLIANISSEAGSVGDCWRKDEFLYCMSKSALNMQTMILKNLLGPQGFELLAIHPGWMRTEMGGANADIDPKEAAEGIFALTSHSRAPDAAIFIDYQGKPMRW